MPAVLKCFASVPFRREITNYDILRRCGVPTLAVLGSSGSFWIYAVICLSAFVFLYCRCPETKGKTLEELERELVEN